MNDSDIEQIASRVLGNHLNTFGFKNAQARSEVDFDGSPVVRIKARYTDERAPTKAMTQSLHEIRSALIAEGEQRFVLLESEYLGDHTVDEDVD